MSDIDDCAESVKRLTRDRGEVMSAGNDEIAEIRARHAATEAYQQSLTDRVRMHNDCAFLLAEVERLNKDIATQQGCCDGAAAQDAHIRRERAERWAEIKDLRANNKRMRGLLSAIQIDTNADGSVWLTLSPSAYPGFIAVVNLGSQKLMAGTAALLFDELRRKALEGKP